MSMTHLEDPLAEEWSRTSTHAMSVPITMFSAVTSTAWVMVSRIAAAVWGW